MNLTLPPPWIRALAWLAMPLVAAVVLALSRSPGITPTDPDRTGADSEQATARGLGGYIQRAKCKREIIDSLREGHLTLFEAASLFRAIQELPPETNWEAFRQRYGGASDEERHCRHVLGWVEASLPPNRVEADPTINRLRQALAAALRGGPPPLPDTSSPKLCRYLPYPPAVAVTSTE